MADALGRYSQKDTRRNLKERFPAIRWRFSCPCQMARLITQEIYARHDPSLDGQASLEQLRPEVLSQAQQRNGRQKEEYGPEPVDDGLENSHEQVWFGRHGSPLRCLEVIL